MKLSKLFVIALLAGTLGVLGCDDETSTGGSGGSGTAGTGGRGPAGTGGGGTGRPVPDPCTGGSCAAPSAPQAAFEAAGASS